MGCASSSTDMTKGQKARLKEYATMARDVYEQYTSTFDPIERELAALSMNENGQIQAAAERAGQYARDQADVSKAAAGRTLSRYGVNLTADQRAAMDREQEAAGTATIADSENRARIAEKDYQDKLRGDVIGLGQSRLSGAMNQMGAASSMTAQRIGNTTAARSQYNAGMMNTIGQLGGMAASAAILMSSREKKKAVAPADTAAHLRTLRSLRIKNYEYRKNAGEPGKRTGVIAEEAPKAVSTGKAVRLGDVLFTLAGAVQELDREVRRLKAA